MALVATSQRVLCGFGTRPSEGSSQDCYWGVARASAHRASSGQISLLREGEDVWSWLPAAETTSQAGVPTEPEAAQTLLGTKGSRSLGENSASAAILS